MSDWNPDKVRVRIARDLREVEQLAAELHWQIYATPNDREMPGGTALHMSAPAANIHDWQAKYDELEAAGFGKGIDPAALQVASEEQPINVLGFWTRVIREERDQPTGLKPTISREVDYLRKNLDWMTRVDEFGEPEWFEVTVVADDLHALVRRMQNVLSVGDRIDTSAAACFRLDGSTANGRCGGTLARVNLKRRGCAHIALAAKIGQWLTVDTTTALRGLLAYSPEMRRQHDTCGDQGGRDDVYRCLKCEKMYTTVEYWLAVRENYEKEAG